MVCRSSVDHRADQRWTSLETVKQGTQRALPAVELVSHLQLRLEQDRSEGPPDDDLCYCLHLHKSHVHSQLVII